MLTWRSEVVRELHARFRIDLVNDISAGVLDPDMYGTMAEIQLPYIMMHMQGTPSNMQDEPAYENVSEEILQYFARLSFKLRKLGVNDLIVDPGFGFGKTPEQNYRLLKQLPAFAALELPLLVGLSRKSMIYETLDCSADEALNGTTAAHMTALMGGARILRVHDVKEAMECIQIFQKTVEC